VKRVKHPFAHPFAIHDCDAVGGALSVNLGSESDHLPEAGNNYLGSEYDHLPEAGYI
jgi:hypothetical protein